MTTEAGFLACPAVADVAKYSTQIKQTLQFIYTKRFWTIECQPAVSLNLYNHNSVSLIVKQVNLVLQKPASRVWSSALIPETGSSERVHISNAFKCIQKYVRQSLHALVTLPRYSIATRLDGPQSWSGHHQEEKNLWTCRKYKYSRPVRKQSPHWLSYPGSLNRIIHTKNSFMFWSSIQTERAFKQLYNLC
jgi:hypothetical protein